MIVGTAEETPVDVRPASYYATADPRRRHGLDFACGLPIGVVVVLLAFAATENHAYIWIAELAGLAAVLLPAATRRWAVLAGALVGACTVIAACVALVMAVVLTGNFSVGGP